MPSSDPRDKGQAGYKMAGIRYVGTTRKVVKLKPKLWKLILTRCLFPGLVSRDASPQGLNSSARKFNFESFRLCIQSRPRQQLYKSHRKWHLALTVSTALHSAHTLHLCDPHCFHNNPLIADKSYFMQLVLD
jgi:hypothetical protein